MYNLATAYNAGGANNTTLSMARKSFIDLVDFKKTPAKIGQKCCMKADLPVFLVNHARKLMSSKTG